MSRYLWCVPALVLLPAACGEGEDPGAGDVARPGAATVYTGVGTVLESPDHGPQLCLGGVNDSYPPQCGGPDIAGWSWDDVEGYESASGTTWGVYSVTGHYDGHTFTLTEPATTSAPGDAGSAADMPDFSSPCPEPDGGWAVVDPEKATDDALHQALESAAAEPDYAGAWLDQSILNVRFTGDLERHEAELREIWGGPLCISQAEHTEAELRAIQEELMDVPGVLGSGVDSVGGMVELNVIVDDGLQARMDEEYGAGTVRVHAALTAVE